MTATREEFQAAVQRISRLPGKRWTGEAKTWLARHGYRTGTDVVAIVVDAADTYRVQGYFTPLGDYLAGYESRRAQDKRIRKVLKWLDAETSEEMVGEYKATAVEQEGNVEAALKLDEAAMAREGLEP